MRKTAATSQPPLDVLVLGEHPAAYLAATALAEKPGVSVSHATIPNEHAPHRLVLINPQFFQLFKPLEKLKKKVPVVGVHGVTFLADDGSTRGEWKSRTAAGCVGEYAAVRKAVCTMAKEAGVKCLHPKSLELRRCDEKGFEIQADNQVLRPKAVLLGGALPGEQAKVLSLPDMFARDVMRRYAFIRLRGEKWTDPSAKPMLAMSLDLNNKLTWAWLLRGDGEVQLCVEQPADDPAPAAELIRKWAGVLHRHQCLKSPPDQLPVQQVQTMEVPAAGALTREIVANRTLLFGPAGGFYTACLEDIYPNCWSAMFAVDAVAQALQQPHLQDALQPYREKWGTTLGEYLRGPQQNLRFLLPLVYRNPVMTARMAESILLGKSVVR